LEISNKLNIKGEEFVEKYLDPKYKNDLVFKNHQNTDRCIFLNEKNQCNTTF
jgi:hypothetical protein